MGKEDETSAPAFTSTSSEGSDTPAEDEQVAREGLGDDFRTTPWVQPTKEDAYQHAAGTTFEGAKASVCRTGPKQLGGLGEGISLYFYILRYLACYFFFATILATPHMILSFSGGAVVDQFVDPFQLIKFTAINHADVGLIYAEEEVDKVEESDKESGELFCKSEWNGINNYKCDFLKTELENGFFVLPLIFTENDEVVMRDEVLTKTQIECDIGCGCGWEDVVCPWSSGTGGLDDGAEELAIPSCPVHATKTCMGSSCGDVFIIMGRVSAINDLGCDCCSSEFQCGAYEPTSENLSFNPIGQNITVTRNDAAAIISYCDIM